MGTPGYSPIPDSINPAFSVSETTGVSGAMSAPIWSGYLVDKSSGLAMKNGDIDLTTSPQDLTKTAEIANGDSGFGISVLQGQSYKFYPFDDHGNALASQLIRSSTRDMGLAVVVRGAIVDGVVNVSSIMESNL
jgi:hypothetical protein